MTHYSVTIVGWAWGGFTSSYRYEFDHLPTKHEIECRAGDFESVTDYEIEATEHKVQVGKGGKVSTETITRRLVREFVKEDSADVVMACNG